MTRRRASAVAVKDNRILMVKIIDKGQSWWCLPGSTVQPNETPEQAVARELCEELGLQVQPRQRLYKSPIPHEKGVDYGILIDLPARKPSLGIDQMVVEWAWRPLDEIDDSWQVDEVRKALSNRKVLRCVLFQNTILMCRIQRKSG